MKKLFIMLCVCIAMQPVFAQDSTSKKLDDLVQAYHDVGKFNGSVLVAKRGKILLNKGYGYKNIKEGTLNDVNTIYQIASITKQFTSAVVLKLIELKKLSLTDKLSRFYRELPSSDTITIENLLTHTSGITDHYDDSSATPATGTEEQKLLISIKKTGLDFSPGSDWHYSNKGYQLLGFIIQKVTGTSYYQAVRKYIFTPLNMTHSGFAFVALNSKDKATGYWSLPQDTSAQPATIIDSAGPFSAGSIYSTVGDLYKWHQGLQSYKVISKASLDEAYTPYKNHYGYGWQIDSPFANLRLVHHGGDIWGFKSDIARVTDSDVCVIELNNIEDPDLGVTTINLLAIVCDKPYKLPARNIIKLSDNALQKYVGGYEMQPGMVIELTLENRHLMATTDHKEELYTQSENLFLLDGGNRQVEVRFSVGGDGKVENLFFYKNDQKIVCKKIK